MVPVSNLETLIEILENLLNHFKYLWIPPVFRVGPLQRLVEGARRRTDDVAEELEEALRLGGAGPGQPAQVEPVQVATGSARKVCLSLS